MKGGAMLFPAKLTISGHLSMQSLNNRLVVLHRLNRKAVVASLGLLKFLDLFTEPRDLKYLECEDMIPDAEKKALELTRIGFLVPENIDEEKVWLKKENRLAGKKKFQTRHFCSYYSGVEPYLARNFTDFMEEIYHLLLIKLFPPIARRAIIYICRDRKELKKFWGAAPLPDHVKTFVTRGRMLVVDPSMVVASRHGIAPVSHMTHEMAHIFLCQAKTNLPVWMTEGLCEYHSRLYNHELFLELARLKGAYPFQQIEAGARHSLFDMDDAPDELNIPYRQSESFVHYLAGISGEKKMMDIIFKTGLSRDFKTVFQKEMGISIDEAERGWLKEMEMD